MFRSPTAISIPSTVKDCEYPTQCVAFCLARETLKQSIASNGRKRSNRGVSQSALLRSLGTLFSNHGGDEFWIEVLRGMEAGGTLTNLNADAPHLRPMFKMISCEPSDVKKSTVVVKKDIRRKKPKRSHSETTSKAAKKFKKVMKGIRQRKIKRQ